MRDEEELARGRGRREGRGREGEKKEGHFRQREEHELGF